MWECSFLGFISWNGQKEEKIGNYKKKDYPMSYTDSRSMNPLVGRIRYGVKRILQNLSTYEEKQSYMSRSLFVHIKKIKLTWELTDHGSI